jgi:hypothetical protein
MGDQLFMWFFLFGDVVEGVGSLLLGFSTLYAIRNYSFGPVSRGLRNIGSLIGWSLAAMGVAELTVTIAEVFGLPLWVEALAETAAGTAVFATALVVLRYGYGILDVLGATRNGSPTTDRSGSLDHGHRNGGDGSPPIAKG